MSTSIVTEIPTLDKARAAYTAALEAEWRAEAAEDAAWVQSETVRQDEQLEAQGIWQPSADKAFSAWKAADTVYSQARAIARTTRVAYRAAFLAAEGEGR